jgi:hypothetical protein
MPIMTKAKSRHRYTPVIILIGIVLAFLFVWGIGDSYLLSTAETDSIQQQHDIDPASKPEKKKNHKLEVAWLMSFGGAVRDLY